MVNKKKKIFWNKKHIYNFQRFETIKSFAKNVFNVKITLNNADEDQSNLLVEIDEFNKSKKPRDFKKKKKKEILLKV